MSWGSQRASPPPAQAKSLAEQADEKAAAVIGKISDAVIEEEEEEEEEAEVASGGGTGEPGEPTGAAVGSVAAEAPTPSGAELMSAMLMAQFDAATAQVRVRLGLG